MTSTTDADTNPTQPGRLLALGDIHGCSRALAVLLERLQLGSADTLVSLGDIVDRGPDTKGCVDLLLQIRQVCQLIVVQGNHEEMMLAALKNASAMDRWMAFGGREVIESYGGIENIPEEHLELIRNTRDFYETERVIFVHANLQPGVPLFEQSVRWLRWEHLSGHERQRTCGRKIVCGHTARKDGTPVAYDNWICIDTFAYGGGWLTCLDVNSWQLYQARETGEYQDSLNIAQFE